MRNAIEILTVFQSPVACFSIKDSYLTIMKQWIILFVICLAWSLMWVDFTAVNVALAPIARDLHTDLETLQWVITAYTVCAAAFMSIGGRLGDMYGHRRLFVLGTFIFTLSSLLAGFSFNATLLILSRVGQGIGIAMVVPIATALVYLTFEKKWQGVALGFLTGTTGIAMAIGPTVGGLLSTYLNWRWVFFINIPTGIIAIILSYILIAETQEKKLFKIDFPGIITLVLGLLCLLFALNKIPDWGFSWYLLGLFLLAIFFVYLFIKCEQRNREPLIDLNLLKNKMLMGVIGVRTAAQYTFFVFMFIISLYLQNILGFTAEKAGYLLLASTIVLGVLSPFAGHAMKYITAKYLISFSCLLIAISLFMLIISSVTGSMVYLLLSLILFGTAFAIHFPTTNIVVLQMAPVKDSALITGILFTVAFAGASAGITLSSALLSGLSKNQLIPLLSSAKISLTEEQLGWVENAASGAGPLNKLDQLPSTISNQIIAIAKHSFVFGFQVVLMICVILVLLGMIITLIVLKNFAPRLDDKDHFILEI